MLAVALNLRPALTSIAPLLGDIQRQTGLAYCVFGWLPFLLQSRGVGVLESGVTMSISIGAQLLTALGGPFIATVFRDQRPAVALFMALTLLG
ncbi:MAG: hypothetical protein RIC38_13830 [Chromatocurvus sp.]